MKWMNTLTPWLLNHVFLNVWIMVRSELVAHDPWNASLQRSNHHTWRGQSLLIIVACLWNEERPSLLFLSRFWNKYIPCDPFFWAWIIFLSWKQIPTRITPHTGGQEKNFNEKWEKAVRKPKRHKEPKKLKMLGGMPKSLEKMTSKIKWVCPIKARKKEKGQIKEERQKKIWMTSRVKLLIVIFSLWNPETLFEPYESFSFIAKNHSLCYVPVEVLSNQASKQPRTINNALIMQRIFFFIRFMTSRINYSLLFMLIKMNVQKETSSFSNKTSSFFFSSPSLWKPIKTKGHLMTCFHGRPHHQTQEQIISLPRKKITKELQDFKSKLF